MTTHTWNDDWIIGIDEIDAQHRNLIEIIGEYSERLQQTTDKEKGRRFIDLLLSYIRMHFATEERHMLNEGFDKLDYHRTRHIELTERILGLQQKYKTDTEFSTSKLASFFDKMLIDHFVHDDQDFKQYLQNRLTRSL